MPGVKYLTVELPAGALGAEETGKRGRLDTLLARGVI